MCRNERRQRRHNSCNLYHKKIYLWFYEATFASDGRFLNTDGAYQLYPSVRSIRQHSKYVENLRASKRTDKTFPMEFIFGWIEWSCLLRIKLKRLSSCRQSGNATEYELELDQHCDLLFKPSGRSIRKMELSTSSATQIHWQLQRRQMFKSTRLGFGWVHFAMFGLSHLVHWKVCGIYLWTKRQDYGVQLRFRGKSEFNLNHMRVHSGLLSVTNRFSETSSWHRTTKTDLGLKVYRCAVLPFANHTQWLSTAETFLIFGRGPSLWGWREVTKAFCPWWNYMAGDWNSNIIPMSTEQDKLWMLDLQLH